MGEPLVEKSRKRGFRGLDVGALGELCDETGAFGLRLSLRPGERMPFRLPLAGLGIADVENNSPMAGRPFANVAFHFPSPACLSLNAATLQAFEHHFDVERRPVPVPT